MTLYSGRIQNESNAWMDAINRSLPVDIRLLPFDVQTNRAWAGELKRIGVLSVDELAAIQTGLDYIMAEWDGAVFDALPADEDVHTLIERLLTERFGPTGAKIHTGRSRNDQVVCDLRLYLKAALDDLGLLVRQVIATLVDQAKAHADTLMAGTTHLQPAQPITLGHFLLSLGAALVRDVERLQGTRRRVDACPLGSGALAGSGFPVDRRKLADALGFADVLPNSIDAISDRDVVQEAVYNCAQIATHLSRVAEQFVIWSHPAFGYVRFNDAFSTGSSMMPQKRNPDAMELVRGKAARVIGQLTAAMTLTKGVPLSYAKDLQEDKALLFDVLDTTTVMLRVFDGALCGAEFSKASLAAALSGDLLATDLADLLTQTGVPFRQAHERVGQLMARLERDGGDLKELSPEILQQNFPEMSLGDLALGFEQSVKRRNVLGGTAPEAVKQQIAWFENWLATNN